MPATFPPSAFSVFFDCPISVEGERAHSSQAGRKVAGSYMACVFDNGYVDPFAEADAESNVRSFGISVKAGDWLDNEPPQVGDRITLPQGNINFKLAVFRVESILGDTWTLTAREVGK